MTMKEGNADYRLSETFDSVSSGSVLFMNETLSDCESAQLLASDISGYSNITRFSLPDCDTTLNDSIRSGSLFGRGSDVSSAYGPELVAVKKGTSFNSSRANKPITEQPQRSCPLCDISMKAVNIFRHMRRSHGWNEEQIDVFKMQLRRKKYEGKKLFECSSCPAVYTSAPALREHQKTYGCSNSAAFEKVRKLAAGDTSEISMLEETNKTELEECPTLASRNTSVSNRSIDISRVPIVSDYINECAKLRNRLATMEIEVVAESVFDEAEYKLEKIMELYKLILATKGNCELKESSQNEPAVQ
ncbi:unnamed protein product [Auanema sp. JU1783]|nr:unnamed protein product [Auanema sp. JU1783]